MIILQKCHKTNAKMHTNIEPIASKKRFHSKKTYFENSIFCSIFIISLLYMCLVYFTYLFNILKYIKHIWLVLYASYKLTLVTLTTIREKDQKF